MYYVCVIKKDEGFIIDMANGDSAGDCLAYTEAFESLLGAKRRMKMLKGYSNEMLETLVNKVNVSKEKNSFKTKSSCNEESLNLGEVLDDIIR